MYLRRLKINGFKSFAGKTVLEFEPGISAIVGPNGSGKSNVADAIRWALGEQSSKNLRLKKSEELVFAGTDKRPKASLAEVSLLLDNSDGQMAIDFSEVELSRLLYRSGESEYRLNGRKVALREVQQLLAQSGFGQNSYAVIGQGMIDSFILATPAERKLLFDEASGIRQYELKRTEAQHKLSATATNLTRARDIVAELQPRMKALERGMEVARRRRAVEAELEQKRLEYLALGQHFHQTEIVSIGQQLATLAAALDQQAATVLQLEQARQRMQADDAKEKSSRQQASKQLHELEVERDALASDLSVKRAELQFMTEQLEATGDIQAQVERLRLELAANSQQQVQLAAKITTAQVAASETVAAGEGVERDIRSGQTKLNKLRRDSEATSRQEYIAQALAILKQVATDLAATPPPTADSLRLLVYKAGRLLAHARTGQDDILAEMKLLQQQLNALLKRRDDIHDRYTNAVIKVRSLELDLEQASRQAGQLGEQLKVATKRWQDQTKTAAQAVPERQRGLSRNQQRLVEIDRAIAAGRQQLSGASSKVQSDRIFGLATDLEAAKSAHSAGLVRRDELTAELARHRGELAGFGAKALDWFGDQAKELDHPAPAAIAGEERLVQLERDLVGLEARMGDGDDDQAVAREYAEVEERYSFMGEQVADLEAAGADMAKLITQLEQLIKTKFELAFADIAQHFSTYFSRLFDGGKASLILKLDEAGAYGIEIKAVPPGKRVEGLAMLSGGERALTGIALLAAILHTSPSPFVALDEVDAALDEANSVRLAGILKDVAKRSQLIVITHNRQTMQAAHSLYGVTMDDTQVSKLLSIRLEEARELAVK